MKERPVVGLVVPVSVGYRPPEERLMVTGPASVVGPEISEKERLRVVIDELADGLADLVIAFDDVKADIGNLAAWDDRRADR